MYTPFTNRMAVISTEACTFSFSFSLSLSLLLTGHKYSHKVITAGSFEGTEKSTGTRADETYEPDA